MSTCLLLSVFMLALAGAPAFADDTSPQDVTVGLYTLNLGRFDVGTGAFTADFYLSFACEGVCPPLNFDLTSRISRSSLRTSKERSKN